MHTFIITLHIIAMSLSLILTATASLLAFLKKPVAIKTATTAMYATIVGGVTGFIALTFAPLGADCVLLTAYLIGFGLLYKFAFGLGDIRRVRYLTVPVERDTKK